MKRLAAVAMGICLVGASWAGNWKPYECNPILGNAQLGTCFDVNVITNGPAPYTMYFSWRPKKAIALVRSDDGFKWSQQPEICLAADEKCGWEDNLNRSCTVYKDGVWHMWYTGQAKGWSRIGYARSKDGVHFVRVQKDPVLVPEFKYETPSTMNPYVRWDESRGVWRMWYAAGEQYEPNVLCHAESKDGIHWIKWSHNPFFGKDAGQTWDRDRVGGCEVHPLPGGGWALFYIGYSDVDTARIGCAISEDGLTKWRRLRNNPIVSPDLATWNGSACYKPSVVCDVKHNRWLLWYNGRNGCPEYVGMAVHDGLDLDSPAIAPSDTKALLSQYVRRFNSKDDELYTNAIPNSSAEDFMLKNVPRFACPDKDIERTYYFRWWTYRKHLRNDQGHWKVTEFLPKVGWSGKANTIVCPAGHHIREGRWLRDAQYVEDDVRFWLSDPEAKHRWQYSSWLFTGTRQFAEVSGRDALPGELLDDAVRYYERWERGFRFERGLPMGGDGKGGFLSIDNHEGTEISLGGSGYKPLFSSAMWSEAQAIAEVAESLGRHELAARFAKKAEVARQSVFDHCWNADICFFTTGSTNGIHGAVRELHGYAPWYFSMPTENRRPDWSQLTDPQGFAAKYGLTFPERRASGFTIDYRGHECKWNGPSWPFATSIALTAYLNELHREHRQGKVDAKSSAVFASLLWQFADAQRLTHPNSRKVKGGDWEVVPWIDENLHPDKAEWISRRIILETPAMKANFPKERGKDYNHSTFCDLVISGIVGFVPDGDRGFYVDPLMPEGWDYLTLEGLRYRGHDVDIRWQRGKAGFTVSVDGREVLRRPTVGCAFVPLAKSDVRKIVFFGDSITEGGQYLTHLQLFDALRNPGRGIEAYNVGKSGDTAKGGLARWQDDGAQLKPDEIFVMFGMNDAQVDSLATAAPTNATESARREKLVADYRENLNRLLDRLAKDCHNITLATPTPYDQYSPQKRPAMLGANEPMLATFAKVVRETAAARKLRLIDLHPAITDLVKAHPEAQIIGGDRVHPTGVGQYLMACLCWNGLGRDGMVGEKELDANGRRSVEFRYAPKSLPMPVSDFYRAVEKFWPVTERLNREMLRVANLPKGDYSLRADGREIGVFSAAQLGAGVNLALLDTPNRRLANRAEKDRARLHQIACDFRSVAYLRQWMRTAKIDFSDLAATKRYFDEQRERAKTLSWGGWHRHCVDKLEEMLPKWDALNAEEQAIRARLRTLRPQSFSLSLAPVRRTAIIGGFGGSLELPEAGLLLRPRLRTSSWESKEAIEDDFVAPVKDGHRFYFCFDDSKNNRLGGRAVFRSNSGGVDALWRMPVASEHKKDLYLLFGAMDLPQYDGAVFTAGDERAVLSTQAKLGVALHRKARDLALTRADGSLVVRMEFPAEVDIVLEKARDWGVVRYNLSLFFVDEKNAKSLSVRFSNAGSLDFREEGPLEIKAGSDWIEYRAETEMVEGSALDFTRFRGTDMPAGRHGWLVARDGHFEFEKLPGAPQRFYGVNICSTANLPDEGESKKFAAKLRKLGYNAIRFHHHESVLVKSDAERGSCELDPSAMRRFDALVAACIENGLYLTTDLFVSRSPISYRSLGIDLPGNCNMDEYKALVTVHEGAYSNFTAFAGNFLNHRNEFTNRRYADEPAFSLISFVNEGNLRGTHWAARKFGLLNDNSKAATAELERKFARRVTKFLREELGCRALFTNMNNFFWDDDPAGEAVRAMEYGYADDHFYVDHPRFIARRWQLPSSCPNTNPLVGIDRGTQRLAATRPLNLPFTTTEYNFSAPGKFRGVGGILTGALGARQDWGGLLRFAWSHDRFGLTGVKRMNYFDMSGDPLGLAAERASMCLFLRRDLAVADGTFAFVIPTEKALDISNNPGSIASYWNCDWAAWHAKIGVLVTNRVPAGVEVISTYPGVPDEGVLEAIGRRSTGGVIIDSRRGALVIDTERTAGGFAESGRIVAGPLVADIGDVPSTVWVSSLDGLSIAGSRRMLLTHLTDVQNSGVRYADSGKRILLAWGDLPHLMRVGKAKISLTTVGTGWKAYRLSAAGVRLGEMPVSVEGGRLNFVADVAADRAAATCLYELVR